MPDVVVISTDSDEDEEAAEEVEEAAEELADSIDDAVMDATTIGLVERVTRIEDALTVMAATVETHSEQLGVLAMTDEVQQQEIEAVNEEAQQAEQIAATTAVGAADAIENVAEDIEEASPEIEPEEIPTTRTHWFFKRWGGKG